MKDKKGTGTEMTNIRTLINKLPKATKENLEIGKTILIKKDPTCDNQNNPYNWECYLVGVVQVEKTIHGQDCMSLSDLRNNEFYVFGKYSDSDDIEEHRYPASGMLISIIADIFQNAGIANYQIKKCVSEYLILIRAL